MEINYQIDLYGIIGWPLSHTLSPALHNALFKKMGLNSIYLSFAIPSLGGLMAGIRGLGIKGVSVTIPFKVDIMDRLDGLDPLAEQMGAVNTIVNRDGHLIGYNTDASGAILALGQVIEVRNKKCLVVGAGGAARAICYALKEKRCEVTIVNRSLKRGKALARALEMEFIPLNQLQKVKTDIIIQTTPIGMYPKIHECPLDVTHIHTEVAMDIIYNPIETRFIKGFRSKQAKVITGVDMFVFQAAEQFKLWTGMVPPIEYMKQVVLKELQTHFTN